MSIDFTPEELAKLPRWAILKIAAIRQAHDVAKQKEMSHASDAVLEAARAFVLVTGRAHTVDDAAKAKLALTMAVTGWEGWASNQHYFSNVMGG